MAIERTPGTAYQDELDAMLKAPRTPMPKPQPDALTLDVDALVHLVSQAQEVTSRIAPPDSRVPVWARGDTAKVAAWTVAVPTLVTGCANLAAHQWGPLGPSITGGAVALLAAVLGVSGMNHHWSATGAGLMLGTSVGAIAWTTAAGSGGWMEVVAWLIAAVGTLGFKIVWNRKHAADRAKVELTQAKTRTERLKGDAVRTQAALKDTHLLLKIQAEQRAATLAATPEMDGATSEERALRKAVWDVFGEQLYSCAIRFTMTGWVATVGLPVALPRSTTLAKWDAVSSALRADGRFIVSNGRLSNELDIKFLDRTKIDTAPLQWTTGCLADDAQNYASLGINTETGEPVLVKFVERTLICGASGTGKSWSTRPLLAHAHIHGDLVFLDGKGEEGNVWQDVCRVANEADEIEEVIDALHDEMGRRKRVMKDRKISVWDGRQLTVFIDEGQVILALVSKDSDRLQRLRELVSLGRSRGIVVWWATQKPTMSGNAAGIDSQMAGNLLQRFSLRVASEQEARTALDDCAHYAPQQIPDDDDLRGHGYLKGYGPSLIRTWTMNDGDVRALPVSRWEGELELEAQRVASTSPADLVARWRMENPDGSQRAAVEALGLSKGTVSRAW